ncbi:unnamed protein product [Effrenium voratum]|uniref:Uncharacterized protein n=1 Tax=Effrenium voratum TaxID=2562239 RepID=A0AA36MNR2_9DINO|nr:unnamed protein product [Effrenium voratum]CAJ1424678.1 unnamed protein product [Effrenium voratum]
MERRGKKDKDGEIDFKPATPRSQGSETSRPPPHHVMCLSHNVKAPKWSFGASPRARHAGVARSLGLAVPGPGTYELSASENAAKTFRRPPKFSFGCAGRELVAHAKGKEKTFPGPGTYGGNFTTFGY